MRVVVVTGMSGGGKLTAIRILEDEGYYCVDNLPARLIDTFMELISAPGSGVDKVVLGLDVRVDRDFSSVEETLDQLRRKGYKYEILFMDASDEVLLKRYKETRRSHPLAPEGGRIQDGIDKERQILKNIRAEADYIMDTSRLLVRELKEELVRIFVDNAEYSSLMVSVNSFGFKRGIPADADLVFDVRFLPNPYYVEELKELTGDDAAVRDFVMAAPQAKEFLDKLTDMITYLLPYYVKEGKNQLVIGIGCTGGRHRSVVVANALYAALKERQEYGVTLRHRDIRLT